MKKKILAALLSVAMVASLTACGLKAPEQPAAEAPAAEAPAAEAEAEANKKVAESLTDPIMEKMYFDKWNGALPKVYGGSADNLINIPID